MHHYHLPSTALEIMGFLHLPHELIYVIASNLKYESGINTFCADSQAILSSATNLPLPTYYTTLCQLSSEMGSSPRRCLNCSHDA